jgi:curved DNA-binding protein CbpA
MSTRETIDESLDYYAIMELKFGASDSEIKKQYYALTKRLHPDLFPELERGKATEKFSLLQKAYTILKDQQLKSQIDVKYQAKAIQKEKLEKMDATKRRLREELEEREAIKKPKNVPVGDLDKLRAESLQEMMNLVKKVEVPKAVENKAIHVKWIESKVKVTQDLIKNIFQSLFGKIESLTVNMEDRKAIIVFNDVDSTKACAKYNWASSKFTMFSVDLILGNLEDKKSNLSEYEELTMIRLRQAAEMQKLNKK